MRRIIYILLVFWLFSNCAKDNGNYDYKQVNLISIDSVKSAYVVDSYDTLKIEPCLTFALSEEENLSYEWTINKKVVSTSLNLKVPVEEKIGTYRGQLCITDNHTDLKYYSSFSVQVKTSFTRALFVLSEKEDGEATISYQRQDKAGSPFVHHIYENANSEFGSLGSRPRQIKYKRNLQSTHFFMVLCEEGDKKMVLLNYSDMTISSFINESGVTGSVGDVFKPSFVELYLSGAVVSDGKIHCFNYSNSQTMYRAGYGDYDLVDWVGTHRSLYAYYWISFDKLSRKFVLLSVDDDPFAFDKFEYINSGDLSFEGQEFIAGGYSATDANEPMKEFIMWDRVNDKCYLYSLNISYQQDPNTREIIVNTQIEKNAEYEGLLSEGSVCMMAPKLMYWYVASGNVVWRIHKKGGIPEKVFESTSGDVTSMLVNDNESKLFVATYDETSKMEHKGTVTVLETDKKFGGNLLGVYSGACDKAVSMTYTGKW